MEFEWDESNLQHMLVDRPHGVTPRLVEEVAGRAAVLIGNPPDVGRTGDYQMIGPDASGRFWTIILVDRGDDRWRPITGWPSTASEIRRYGEATA